jgi:hypothetical protein
MTIQASLVLRDIFSLTLFGMDNLWPHLSSVGSWQKVMLLHAISHVYGLNTLMKLSYG